MFAGKGKERPQNMRLASCLTICPDTAAALGVSDLDAGNYSAFLKCSRISAADNLRPGLAGVAACLNPKALNPNIIQFQTLSFAARNLKLPTPNLSFLSAPGMGPY